MEQAHLNRLKETSGSVAPYLVGAAAGMLLSDLMHERARRSLALILGCAGVAALVPGVSQAVVGQLNNPATKRGSRRTLRSIRDGAGAPPIQGIDFVEEELGEQPFLG